jgi:hypothetical protein
VARRLEPLDADLARETYLQALGAALWAGESEQPGILREVASSPCSAPWRLARTRAHLFHVLRPVIRR